MIVCFGFYLYRPLFYTLYFFERNFFLYPLLSSPSPPVTPARGGGEEDKGLPSSSPRKEAKKVSSPSPLFEEQLLSPWGDQGYTASKVARKEN